MDTGRNFFGKEAVLNLLSDMAAYKLNRFHFHLSDDEGWRLQIDGLPELTEVRAARHATNRTVLTGHVSFELAFSPQESLLINSSSTDFHNTWENEFVELEEADLGRRTLDVDFRLESVPIGSSRYSTRPFIFRLKTYSCGCDCVFTFFLHVLRKSGVNWPQDKMHVNHSVHVFPFKLACMSGQIFHLYNLQHRRRMQFLVSCRSQVSGATTWMRRSVSSLSSAPAQPAPPPDPASTPPRTTRRYCSTLPNCTSRCAQCAGPRVLVLHTGT